MVSYQTTAVVETIAVSGLSFFFFSAMAVQVLTLATVADVDVEIASANKDLKGGITPPFILLF